MYLSTTYLIDAECYDASVLLLLLTVRVVLLSLGHLIFNNVFFSEW